MRRDHQQGEPILQIRDLHVQIPLKGQFAYILCGINLAINRGEVMGIVGESGCGKSITARSIIGLLPERAIVTSGQIIFAGEDLLKKNAAQMNHIRAKYIAAVFQDPLTYLNPVLTVRSQILEAARAGLNNQINPPNKSDLEEMCLEALRLARLTRPQDIMQKYPFELSGGMRQRAMIAMALVRHPEIIIADEITTALDVTTQSHLLYNLNALQKEINTTILMVTHDMGVVASTCDRVAVMYAGSILELGSVKAVFRDPKHPYTRALLAAIPKRKAKSLSYIEGSLPDSRIVPEGCRFRDRCQHRMEHCSTRTPALLPTGPGQHTACHLYTKAKI